MASKPQDPDRDAGFWLVSQTVTITVTAYNFGTGRKISVTGPSGEKAYVPVSPESREPDRIVETTGAMVESQLRECLALVDQGCRERYEE